MFGVQAGGECWSSANASLANANQTYNKYGSAGNCREGAGESWANDVYQVEGEIEQTFWFLKLLYVASYNEFCESTVKVQIYNGAELRGKETYEEYNKDWGKLKYFNKYIYDYYYLALKNPLRGVVITIVCVYIYIF